MSEDIAAQKELRKKWVEALRSGKYQQGKKRLCEDNKFCCLGVLCDITGADYTTLQGVTRVRQYDGLIAWLPVQVMEKVGLSDSCGHFGPGESLTQLNDTGKTFKEIADFIESEPPGLFIET